MSVALELVPAGGVYVATFLFALVGGIVPVFNVEVYLLSLAALSPGSGVLGVALAASLGQMAAKSLLYLGGRGLLKLPFGVVNARMGAAAERLARAEGGAMTLVLASALTGLPPFYGVSVAAGALRYPFGRFFAAGGCGRFLRFALVFALPALV